MKAKNQKEFLRLIKIYETISLKTIENHWEINGSQTLKSITGFGSIMCPLCIAVDQDCRPCVYSEVIHGSYGCLKGYQRRTFDEIARAKTPEDLLKACWLRAKHMRKVLDIAKSKNKKS